MARSGELILDSLFNNAIQRELVPSRLPATRIGIFFSVLAAEFEGWEQVLDNFRNESFLETATIRDNVEKLSDPMYDMIHATPSEVILRVSWQQGAVRADDLYFNFGDIAQTGDTDPIEFMLVENGTLFTEIDSIKLKARSVETGANTYIPSGAINSFLHTPGLVDVTNPLESWGGRDAETIEELRSNAMSARYSMLHGTENYLRVQLSSMGLMPYQYNIVDNAFGYGSFCVFVHSDNLEQIIEINNELKEAKSAGIYGVCDFAEEVELSLTFDIRVVKEHDITAEERTNLKVDLSLAVVNYITTNGVGKRVLSSKLTYFLYEQLLAKYNLYDITISTDVLEEYLLDEHGNIIIKDHQVIVIEDIDINIITA